MAGAMWERRRAEAGARRFSRCEYYYILFSLYFWLSSLQPLLQVRRTPTQAIAAARQIPTADPWTPSAFRFVAIHLLLRYHPREAGIRSSSRWEDMIKKYTEYVLERTKNHVTLLYVVVYCGRTADKGMADMQ